MRASRHTLTNSSSFCEVTLAALRFALAGAALDRVNEFLVRFGMQEDLQDIDEAEPRFREVRAVIIGANEIY